MSPGLIVDTEPVQSRSWVDGFFSSFRMVGWPTLYTENHNPVTSDVLEAGFIYAACIIFLSFLLVLPGIRGKERSFVFCRFTYSLFVFLIIMLANFGQEWETSHIHTKTQYKSGTGKEIEAEVGIKIGLHSVNITLKGTPQTQYLNGANETINYNERFYWSNPWSQGRIGFGTFAGEVNREYRQAQYKGLPYPILWIAEYFTLDGEGIRWGRHYRQAGFYSHIFIWTAFPLWILANILFFMVVRYGAYFMTLTGLSMVLANVIFSTIRNASELKIPFEDGVLDTAYGWCYWINLITGLACIGLGIIVVFMDLRFPRAISTFFGVDILADTDEFYAEPGEAIPAKQREKTVRPVSYRKKGDEVSTDDDDTYVNNDVETVTQNGTEGSYQPIFRKRMGTLASRFAKSARKPRPAPRAKPPPRITEEEEDDDDPELYENVPPARTHREIAVEMGEL